MTMLDRMRRHKNWLKWSLILVCLAFVVFYIPDFVRDPAAGFAAADTVATVADRVGYESEAAFSRAFKKALGTPPSQWRKRHGAQTAAPKGAAAPEAAR